MKEQESSKENGQRKLDETSKNLEPIGIKGAIIARTENVGKIYIKNDAIVDREAAKGQPIRPPTLRSVRFYVMAIALISPFVTTYSRTIINFAITDMIDPEVIEVKTTTVQTNITEQLLANGTTVPYFDLDHSCPVEDEDDRQKLLDEMKNDVQRARNIPGEKYKWDTFKQGLLKAAFSIGHTPFQIPGSRLSEMYGSQKVLGICSLLITTCCLLAPYLASVHFYLIFADLILLGVWGSFMTPALITLFANWLTPSEKSLMMSFYLIASRLGYALSSILCGILIEAHYSWRNVFFSAGWIALTFATILFFGARSRPDEHPLMSKQELEYLASKNTLVKEALDRNKKGKLVSQECELKEVNQTGDGNRSNGKKVSINETINHSNGHQHPSSPPITKTRPKLSSAPWWAIVTNVPVIAFVVTKFCVKLAGDTAQIELPSYLKRVMHFSAKKNGVVNASNYVIFCLGCAGIGALATWFNKTKPFGLSKTAIRKLFQCISSFGVSLTLIGIAYSVCDNLSTQIFLLSMFLITTFGIGGEAQMPMDLTERYSGTIHALGSSLAISGVIEPTLVGYLLRGHAADRDSWKSVWLGASIISFVGGMIFLLFGDANIQPFDNIDTTSKQENKFNGEKEKSSSSSLHANGNKKGNDNEAFVREEDVKDLGSNGSAPMQHRESREI